MNQKKHIEFHDSILRRFDFIDENIIMQMTDVFVNELYKSVVVICKEVISVVASNSHPIGMMYPDGEILDLQIYERKLEMLVQWCDYNNPDVQSSLTTVKYTISCKQIDVIIEEN